MTGILDLCAQRTLAGLRAAGRERRLRAFAPAANGRIQAGPHTLLDLSSNDTLGLAGHPALAARAAEWAQRWGTGSRASRLVTGTLPPHLALEARLAAFSGQPAALLFASGWQANAALLPALAAIAPGLTLFADHDIHASLLAGCRAAALRPIRWRHHDLDHLQRLLARTPATGPRALLTESVFSMDGSRADLAALRRLADAHDAALIVDDAHAIGTLGPAGRGLAHAADLVIGTASKALGGFGAWIATSQALADALASTCSGFIHTTAPAPPSLGALDAALDLLPQLDAARTHLARTATWLRAELHALGHATLGSHSHIIPVPVGREAAALALAAQLEHRKILAIAIRPPTVAPGQSRLRLALSTHHHATDLHPLIEALRRAGGTDRPGCVASGGQKGSALLDLPLGPEAPDPRYLAGGGGEPEAVLETPPEALLHPQPKTTGGLGPQAPTEGAGRQRLPARRRRNTELAGSPE